jgi:protein-S-isoprenylcysteine O-methyltransferase Ste14
MILAYAFVLVYVTWLFYIAVMSLKRAKDAGTIPRFALVIGYPALFMGLIFDLLCTLTVGTVLFLDLPRELTLTARLKRYDALKTGFRYRITRWLADNLLDPFDPSGKHV